MKSLNQKLGENALPIVCVIMAGIIAKPDAQNFLLQGAKCQLDIFCATEKTWATLNLCLCERAKTFGLHWNPYRGLDRNGDLLDTPTEETIYAALNLPFIIPEYRELNNLRSLPCR